MELEHVVADAKRVFPDELPPRLFQRERFVVRGLLEMRFPAAPPILSLLEKPFVGAINSFYNVLECLTWEFFEPREATCPLGSMDRSHWPPIPV